MKDKIIHILKITLLFFIVSNPMLYRLTDALLTPCIGHITYGSGLPMENGLLIHSIVFAVLLFFLH
jgi:hypothetical protein